MFLPAADGGRTSIGLAITSLRTCEDWRHCIEVACGVALTRHYIATRMAELSDAGHHGTRRFVETWGDAHRVQVLAARKIRQ